MATTVTSEKALSQTHGGPSGRSMVKSFVLHVLALIAVLMVPMGPLHPPRPKEVEVAFHRPAPPKIVAPALPPAPAHAGAPGLRRADPRPAPAAQPKPVNDNPLPGNPELPPEPESAAVQEAKMAQKVGKSGILALRDKFASLALDKVDLKLGANARYNDAANKGGPSSSTILTSSSPSQSGGINVAGLNRSLGGGGGGGRGLFGGGGGNGEGGGGGGGGDGFGVGKATSPIAPGGDRPLAHAGPGPARTDEEIQIVFDRYKAAFYRVYHRELRKDPTLQGQIVLRLTIEPDGTVSMCQMVSSDMNAPDLGDQVVGITKTINFGPKEGVQALTITYPIDFLPAGD